MRRRWLLGIGAGLLGLGIGACSLLLDFDPDDLLERTASRCSDGVDNDGNGLVDCAEPDCAQFAFCRESGAEACTDRVDNDRDGWIDCVDPDCAGVAACDESPGSGCTDGEDGNGNGLVDCQDYSCDAHAACCGFVLPILEDGLGGDGDDDCQPASCALGGVACHAFVDARWIVVGDPQPRRAAGGAGLDPNRCPACYASGGCAPCRDAVLVSRDTLQLRGGLEIGAMLHVGDEPYDRAGLALTWQTTFDASALCADDAPFDRVIGVELVPDASAVATLRVVVDNAVQRTVPLPTRATGVLVSVDDEGFAAVRVVDALDAPTATDVPPVHRTPRPLAPSLVPLHLALHGGGSGLRVSTARVRDLTGCWDPLPVPAPASGAGVVLDQASVPFASLMLSDPAIVAWNGEYHLYFTRVPPDDGPRSIGHAVAASLDGGGAFTVDASPVLAADALGGWAGPAADLTAPAPVVADDGTLRLYFGLGLRGDAGITWSGIVGASSSDGRRFAPLPVDATQVDGRTVEGLVLAPVRGEDRPAGDERPSWEAAVGAPALLVHDPAEGGEWVLLYVGRGDPVDPFTARIGLAIAEDGLAFRRAHVVALDPGLPARNEPVVAPGGDAILQTGLLDPTFTWDASVGLYRLWYVWRSGYAFTLQHAVSPDGLSWLPHPENPVLIPGDAPWCDDEYLDAPWAWVEPSGRLRLWYHGKSALHGHAICYAEASPRGR